MSPNSQEYRAGERLFIDYAGDKIPVYDRRKGEVDFEASLFVAVLGASNYTFAEASRSQELACWINSHIRALEFIGGVPEIAIPDNTKTGVKHPCRYEPELNQTYRELAEHYRFAGMPTRPRTNRGTKRRRKSESTSPLPQCRPKAGASLLLDHIGRELCLLELFSRDWAR